MLQLSFLIIKLNNNNKVPMKIWENILLRVKNPIFQLSKIFHLQMIEYFCMF